MNIVYYKAIRENEVIGVSSCDKDGKDYIDGRGRWCGLDKAQYISINGNFYHCDWLNPEDNKGRYETLKIVEISEEEYNDILKAIEDGKEITYEEEIIEEQVEQIVEDEDTSTLEFIKKQKKEYIDKECRLAIYNGFDATLSDGKHHFSMTIQDQMNILFVQNQVLAGNKKISYHADGEDYKDYTNNDARIIVTSAMSHKQYHQVYSKVLKKYIDKCNDVEIIKRIEYGVDISSLEDIESVITEEYTLNVGETIEPTLEESE